MNLKKCVTILLSLIMAISLLGGCSKDNGDNDNVNHGDVTPPSSDGTVQEDTQEDITLRFMWWGGDARAEATLKVIDQFETLYPWITIEPEYGSDDGYNDKLAAQFSSNTAPDIIQMGVGWMPDYVGIGGLFVDFNDFDIDLSGFDPEFLANNGSFNGSVYGLPTGIAGSAILVNEDLANAIGIDFTSTYSYYDLIEMGQKVKDYDPDLYLLTADSTILVAHIVRAWTRQVTGKPVIDDETLELTLTLEQMEELMAFIASLYDNNVLPPASYLAAYGSSLQTDANWIDGKYVAAFCYTSTMEVLAAANPDANYIAGNLPVLDSRVNDGWYTDCPQYMTVYASSDHPEAAVMFLDYFYNHPDAALALGTTRSIPPTEMAREVSTNAGLISPLTESAVNICLTFNGKSDAGKTTSQEMIAIMEDMVDYVAFGMGTPSEVAQEAITLINNYLSTQR